MKYADLKSKGGSSSRSSSKKDDSRGKVIFRYVFVVLLLLFLASVLTFVFSDKARALFDPVSIVASFNSAELKQTDGRINIMLLGSDRRADDPVGIPERADTILVVSISKVDKNLVLISVPRDLWVESSVCGRCKITEVYAYATMAGVPSSEEVLQDVVEDVLGIPVHYYAVINFDLFEDAIDALGGVTVDVENAFDDYMYPIEGMEDALCGRTEEEIDELLGVGSSEEEESSEEEVEDTSALRAVPVETRKSLLEVFPCRYEHIHFEAGEHEMDGERALKYVRSRHGNNGEGTDFARAARQQRVIMAVKKKATSLGTLLNFKKVQELYNLYLETVITNVDFATMQELYLLSQEVDFSETRTIVLDDRSAANEGGLLYHPVDTTLYRGAYVLLPRAGNYSQIRAYVQKFLFGE
jgi:polyisoprenyl-teichoic acid--peptidoglycan teichoic acid transferase